MAEALAMIDEVGMDAISQDAVAKKVGITQSALRHHFPTRESLFDAIFDHAFSGFYRSAEKVLLEPGSEPRQRLMKLCTLHVTYTLTESDRVARYLVAANLTGHDSHGVVRVPRYVDLIGEGVGELGG